MTHPIDSATAEPFKIHSQFGHLHFVKNAKTKMEQFHGAMGIEMPDANLLR